MCGVNQEPLNRADVQTVVAVAAGRQKIINAGTPTAKGSPAAPHRRNSLICIRGELVSNSAAPRAPSHKAQPSIQVALMNGCMQSPNG